MRWLLTLFAISVASSVTFAQLDPPTALKSMQPGPGLQVELFASEPMLINPTAIDVDHLGRVWVAEAVNYRRKNFGRPILRKEGDRIQVLIDKDGDGKADEAKTFYQGEDLIAPLSVLVLPQADGKSLRVLVAQSPDILEFWDRDGDLKADGPPTKFMSGFQGFDHDHGVHGLTVGPDGKLYFTVGDSGVKGLQSKNGKGKSWTTNATDCQKATVWRVDLDGNNLELIAHNFRNNYEACVDSFGEIWCSDNDDDGNQQTRICHVLPGGNYGYGPRGPGQSHWHEEQPGIVHKTLRTGFGSPTGICFYEGNLLPKQYQGDLIHADAGPREIRYFKRIPKGAGYELEKTVMLTSIDTWFRPSDVCVAPDGSVFVSDWYDPGVGGHGMGDWTRGRIYRLTPTGHQGYKVPEVTTDAISLLKLPCSASRYIGYQHANSMQKMDIDKIIKPVLSSDSIDLQARVFWAIAKPLFNSSNQNPKEFSALNFTIRMCDGNIIRMYPLAVRIDRILFNKSIFDTPEFADWPDKVTDDAGPIENAINRAIYREILVNAKETEISKLRNAFFYFAKWFDGQDRTYLSALNIACGTDPVRRDAILADFEKHFPEWNDKVADLVWELRPKSMLPKMGKLLDDPKLTEKQKARIVDILAVNDDIAAGKTMFAILKSNDATDMVKARAIENLKLFLPTKWKELRTGEDVVPLINSLLDKPKSQVTALRLIAVAGNRGMLKKMAEIVTADSATNEVRMEAIRTLSTMPFPEAVSLLNKLATIDKTLASSAVEAIGPLTVNKNQTGADQKATTLLQEMVADVNREKELRVAALKALAGTRNGTGWLLKQHEEKKLPAELVAETGSLLRNSPFQGERNKAMILFPVVAKLNREKLASLAKLAKKSGDAKAGEKLMLASAKNDMQCLKCHKVNSLGGEIGPDLSAIGTKGSKENLFESMLFPSRAIADQFVSWTMETADGQSITGLLVKETETAVTIRDANGKDTVIDIKRIEKRRKSLVSLMPDDLYKQFTEQELIDMVAYLGTLKADVKK